MPEIEKKYGRNSNQYKILENRVKMTCKLQNAQIDKAKIGKKVKGIPKIWTDRKYIDEKYGKNTKESNMYKELLLDRHPYFFIHLYSKTKAKYKKFIDEYDGSSYNKFGLGIFELINLENKTKEQQEYIDLFNEYMPVIFNECVMNNICRYLENVGKDIKQYFKTENCNSYYELFLDDIELDKKILNECNIEYKKFKKNIINDLSLNYNNNKKYLNKIKTNKSSLFYDKFKNNLIKITNNINTKDYAIKVFYELNKGSNKDILWKCFGEEIFNKLLQDKSYKISLPFINNLSGKYCYQEDFFEVKEVDLCNIMK